MNASTHDTEGVLCGTKVEILPKTYTMGWYRSQMMLRWWRS